MAQEMSSNVCLTEVAQNDDEMQDINLDQALKRTSSTLHQTLKPSQVARPLTSGSKNSIFRARQGTAQQMSPKNGGLLKTQVHQSQGDRVILDFKRASFNGQA